MRKKKKELLYSKDAGLYNKEKILDRQYILLPNSISKTYGPKFINDIKKMGSDLGVSVKTKLFVGFPDEEIVKEAGKNDLIVIGCKGHSALSRIFIGSVCEKVLHHSSSPVMIIR